MPELDISEPSEQPFFHWTHWPSLPEGYLNQSASIDAMEQKLCACGCGGNILWKRHHRWTGVRFIRGHASRGTKQPRLTERNLKNNPASRPEVKEKIRIALLKKYASGELIAPNKGKHLSPETKKKLSDAKLGKHYPNLSLAKKGKPSSFKGKHHSEEAKKKLSIAHLGKTTWMKGKKLSDEERIKMSLRYKGIKRSEEFKEKRRLFMLSDRNPLRGRVRSKEWSRKIIDSRVASGWKMPIKDTSIEKLVQTRLLNERIQFTTHKPIFGLPDIFIEPNLCIFCDGDYWHANPQIYKSGDLMKNGRPAQDLWNTDARVTQSLENKGYVVLRFWECDIKKNLSLCVDKILETIKQNGESQKVNSMNDSLQTKRLDI